MSGVSREHVNHLFVQPPNRDCSHSEPEDKTRSPPKPSSSPHAVGEPSRCGRLSNKPRRRRGRKTLSHRMWWGAASGGDKAEAQRERRKVGVCPPDSVSHSRQATEDFIPVFSEMCSRLKHKTQTHTPSTPLPAFFVNRHPPTYTAALDRFARGGMWARIYFLLQSS